MLEPDVSRKPEDSELPEVHFVSVSLLEILRPQDFHAFTTHPIPVALSLLLADTHMFNATFLFV